MQEARDKAKQKHSWRGQCVRSRYLGASYIDKCPRDIEDKKKNIRYMTTILASLTYATIRFTNCIHNAEVIRAKAYAARIRCRGTTEND